MTDITAIIQAVITLTGAVITAFFIPFIRNRTTERQRETIRAWVKIAVSAAEQLFREPGMGKEKKAYVLEFLAGKGFGVDVDSLEVMIESAVREVGRQ